MRSFRTNDHLNSDFHTSNFPKNIPYYIYDNLRKLNNFSEITENSETKWEVRLNVPSLFLESPENIKVKVSKKKISIKASVTKSSKTSTLSVSYHSEFLLRTYFFREKLTSRPMWTRKNYQLKLSRKMEYWYFEALNIKNKPRNQIFVFCIISFRSSNLERSSS